jgi:maltose alpha-D-glucosyltransferase/alpha-amylase
MKNYILFALVCMYSGAVAQENKVSAAERWYKHAIIYNLDVHTFQDSDGDGVGDFAGLTARLSYLKDLGVDVIWLAPFQPSPHQDDGYDITDYYGIDSSCGTPGDFAAFMYRAHQLGFRVMMDIVFSHTSDQHPWFLQAAADSTSRYYHWYVWSKEKPANQHKGVAFPGVQTEIWTYNKPAKAYYYHRFYNFQPHLNYINPEVQEECQHILGYWLAQGMAGFRVDAVPFIVEIPNKVSDKMDHDSLLVPALRQFVQWRQGDVALLGEANVLPAENDQYFGKKGEGLHMMFNFYANQYLFYGLATGDMTLFRHALAATRDIDLLNQWVWFLRMHDEIDLGRLTDQQRQTVYAKMGPEKDMQLYDRGIRRRLAPMLHNKEELAMAYSLLFALPGTPMIRYGEELGMGDDLRLKERLAVRTPMQWSHEQNAGFTEAARAFRPIISGGEYGYQQINVNDENYDPQSLLNHIRTLIRVRRECPEIGLGRWSIPDSSSSHVLVMRYDYEGKSLLVLHNFSDQPQRVSLPASGPLNDLFTGETLKTAQLTLSGYGYKWYRIGAKQP